MPSLEERGVDAWTALAAEPAVRAAERAIVTESGTVLTDTLAIATSTAARRRLARVLDLKERADRDVGTREAYQRAAEDFRSWAAGVYLSALREPPPRTTPPIRSPSVNHANPHTEESISLRRLVPRPPFPGQKSRHAYHREARPDDGRALPAVSAGSPARSAAQQSNCTADGWAASSGGT